MSSKETEQRSVPPFIEEPPPAHQSNTPQFIRLVLMLVGFITLLISMLGAGKLLWEILNSGLPDTDVLIAKLFWLVIPFTVGWIVSLINIRVLNNLLHPLMIRGFIWLILGGILSIYVRIIYKLYTQDFFAEQYLRYSLVFVAGFSALVGFHLLLEDHDLRPYSIPIALVTFIHLLTAVLHYVFQDGSNLDFAIGDGIWLFSMVSICLLMALHLGILNPFRQTLDRLFPKT